MNILFSVSGYLLPGGVQIVTKYLCEGLVERGHSVAVISNTIDGHANNEIVNGVQITRFKEKDIFKIHTGEKKEFQNHILNQSNDYDCIITVCAQSFASEWFWPLIDRVDCKTILYMHGMREEKVKWRRIHGFKHGIKELILVPWWRGYFKRNWKYITRYNQVVHLFMNDSSYNYFTKHGYTKNTVILNSCDDDFFLTDEMTPSTMPYEINGKYFICVANYDDNKNQCGLLDAFINSKVRDTNMVFVGSKEKEYSRKLINMVKESNAKNVKVLINIPRSDTIRLIKNSYAVVLASKSEYFPLSIVEGMAAGKPFISSDVGIVPMLPGGNIAHNKSEFEYWMEYYNTNQDYVSEMGNIARQYAIKHFRKQDIITKFESLIHS